MTEPPKHNSENIIEQAVQQFVDAQLQGQKLDIDEFVKQYPDFESQIRQRLQNLQEIDSLFACLMQADESDFDIAISEHNLIGKNLGDFEILRLIGTGGMGAVFLAKQVSLDREVALKVVSDISGARGKSLERFKREAKVLAKISHPNIVPIYEVGQQGPYSYFAMEYVQGVSLDKILSSIRKAKSDEKASDVMRKCLKAQAGIYANNRPEDNHSNGAEIDTDYIIEISRVIVSIATALAYAHEKGILHRDVKPSNILIASDGTAKLVDFGLAKGQTQETITITGEFFGTPSYVSPEQIRKPDTVDCRSDVFSLAATFYECLTLHPPFSGGTVNETLTQVISREAVPPKKYCPRLSTDFNTVLLHALEKLPEDRYQTAGDFVGDIRNILEFKPITTKRPSITRRAYKTLRRNPLKIAIIGISILVIVLGYFLFSSYMQVRNKAVAKKLYDIALLKHQNGEFPEALKNFKKAVRANPVFAEAYSGLGMCYYALGQQQKSIEAYQQAVRIEPDYAFAYNNLGFTYNNLGRYEEAIKTLNKAIEVHPDNAYAHNNLGLAYNNLGRYEEAIQAYQRSIEIDPSVGLPLNNLGLIYNNLGRYEDAVQISQSIITINPNNAKAHCDLGDAYRGLSRFKEAVLAYRQALRIDPNNAIAYNNLGLAYNNLGRHKEAIQAFKQAIRISPNDTKAYSNLGLAYTNSGSCEDAIEAYRKSINIEPNNAMTYYNLGTTYSTFGHYTEALQALKQAIYLRPNYALAYNNIAVSFEGLGRYEEAEEAYKQAIEVEPDSALGYNNIGIFYGRLGRYDEGIEFVKQAISIDSNNAVPYKNLAFACNQLKRYEEAIQACQQAIIINPNNASVYNELGLANRGLTLYEEAIKCHKHAIEIDLNNIIAFGQLAIIYVSLSRHEEAIQAYKAVIKIDPNRSDAFFGLGCMYMYGGLKQYGDAIKFLRQACKLTDYKDNIYIATLAFVYAEIGDFEKAIEYQRKAIELLGDREFTGIGITYNRISGQTMVTSLLPDTPASKSGILVGDVIEAIDGRSTESMSVENIMGIITGPKGTKVTLTIKHNGKDTTEDITITRNTIVKPMIVEYEKQLAAYKAGKPWRK